MMRLAEVRGLLLDWAAAGRD